MAEFNTLTAEHLLQHMSDIDRTGEDYKCAKRLKAYFDASLNTASTGCTVNDLSLVMLVLTQMVGHMTEYNSLPLMDDVCTLLMNLAQTIDNEPQAQDGVS